jgi:hypothetical protein
MIIEKKLIKKMGIIQSRGLGDIIIALPIAHYYYTKENYQIYWPVLEEFLPSLQTSIPWIKWIPLIPDPQGQYFYNTPLERLKNFGCTFILPLYQALTGHKFHEETCFQHTKFDQHKYITAQVPFLEKWNLTPCITRDLEKEQLLYSKLVTNPNYCIIHLEGSDSQADFDKSIIPTDWQLIYITKSYTDNIFDWLTLLEKAQALILVDSAFANLADQLSINKDLYFIPRSHNGLTPVLGNHWTWITNTRLDPKANTIRLG